MGYLRLILVQLLLGAATVAAFLSPLASAPASATGAYGPIRSPPRACAVAVASPVEAYFLAVDALPVRSDGIRWDEIR